MYDITKIKKYIYFLDMTSLKNICKNIDISYNIYLETDDYIKKTNEVLHKEFIIDAIINKLKYNKNTKVIYTQKIQNYDDLGNIDKNDYVYYGQYNTTNKKVYKLMKLLTNNKFKFGAISQKLIKYHWGQNILLTYKKFAKLWLDEFNKGDIKYEELAYNQFMKKHGNINEWKLIKKEAEQYFISINLL